MWARLEVSGAMFEKAGTIDLQFETSAFSGTLGIVMPEALLPDDLIGKNKAFGSKGNGQVKKWADLHAKNAERLFNEGRFSREDFDRLNAAMKTVYGRPMVQPRKPGEAVTLSGLPIKAADRHTMFLRIDPPEGAKVGDRWNFSVIQRDAATGRVQGGSDYSVRINKPAK
jgi:hypothetical protein